jgi:retron-type reverse transcriptase
MQVYSAQLMAAWSRVQQGSRAAGVDGVTIDLFAGVAQEQIQQLQFQLQRESYFASPAKAFWLAKPSGGQRLIGIPTVRDRLVQRYLLQQIYPRLERSLSEAAFAYRPGLSIYTAVARVMERYRHQPNWVIKADIQQFFDNLTWTLLLNQLEQLRRDASVVRWIEQQLKSNRRMPGLQVERGAMRLDSAIGRWY